MRRVADAVGVSTGTLYHYFPNKAALFEQVVRTVSDEDIAAGTQLLVGAFHRPEDRLVPLFTFLASRLPKLTLHFRVLVEFAAVQEGDPQHWQASLTAARQRYLDAISHALGFEDRSKADLVLLAISGLILRSLSGDPSTEPRRVAETLRSVLFPDAPGAPPP
jgi:AcrR family transcriptional regulator